MNAPSNAAEIQTVRSPEGPEIDALCRQLAELTGQTDASGTWPAQALNLCGKAGVFRWFLSEEHGGFGWDAADQTRGYLKLAAADLTTTFVITQRMGACRRIATSENESLARRWLPGLLDGSLFATVGISHLTTSGRHLAKPLLAATETDDGIVLSGFSPWVTGGAHADMVVVGATLDDGRQLLAAVPMPIEGAAAGEGSQLVALTASCTDRLQLDDVKITRDMLIAGPVEDVMSHGSGGAPGGLQTSTLALGLAQAAIAFLDTEASKREDLRAASDQLAAEACQLQSDLLSNVSGSEVCSAADLRGRANRIALRATQAALTAAKGAGFVQGHPAGRWCREALFFLVWSCPQPIAAAHLCELAGIE